MARTEDGPALETALAGRIRAAFDRGAGYGLLHLGGAEVAAALPAAFAFWRELGGRYVAAVCTHPEAERRPPELAPPPDDELDELVAATPVMPGAEYVTAEVLRTLWRETGAAFAAQHAAAGGTVAEYLKTLDPAWNVVGRVHFNLAENRRDEELPFAFLATYTDRLAAHGTAQHLPLGQALREYAGAARKDRLLALLLPVQRAAEACPWLKRMVDAGEIFHPLRFSPQDAFTLLGDVPALERAGVIVRMPAAWRGQRPARPQVTATVGGSPPAGLGLDALLDFRVEVAVGGDPLSAAEIASLLAGASGLALIRGRWVEVDRDRLAQALDRYSRAERLAAAGALTFAAAMRMLSGASIAGGDDAAGADPAWAHAVPGAWLAATLAELRSPAGELAAADPGDALRGTLRPYQRAGVRWLHLLTRLGLGACLADDMGLGKTIQVLALLLTERHRSSGGARRPSLLVAPASLLANWAAEIGRFAPDLRFVVAHASALPAAELRALDESAVAGADLVITSYASLLRLPALAAVPWRLAILDEAQAIKNPDAKQTRAVKKLRAEARVALTGTPVENRLTELWSIFDFVNPGLLGSAKAFTAYARRLQETPGASFAPLRELVRPYILRRLKTDKRVISDLPDKVEMKAFCQLSRRQAALYQQAVDELAAQLDGAEGIARRGVVLAALMRFKQICNHPSQWLGDGAWAEEDSGKWARLRELAEVIAAKQEKVLVFTQFREVTSPLAAFLGSLFGRPGLVLHGQTVVARRAELVNRFQEDESVPFFVLSLKAGGAGLNLTAAAHVVHFDRWWNPAVENQATDRAFRIGQKKNVLVHKLVCRGTIEEKIDALIESKARLSHELLAGGAEVDLTAMTDGELLRLVSLDLAAATKE